MSRLFAIEESLNGEEIRDIRRKMSLTQKEFAELVNVSVKTIERWETGDKPVIGPVVTLVKLLHEFPQIPQMLRVPEKAYPLRLWYMCGNDVCTVIDVDERSQLVQIHNFTNRYQFRAFGRQEHPTYLDYEEFLESRCFPRSRDKMKWLLREMDLPFYEPLLIIEQTQGRMAEDDFWIKIER